MVATEGLFDKIPVRDVREAAKAVQSELSRSHSKLMDTLNKGDKPDEKMKETILSVAKKITKDYEEKK